MPDYKRAAAVPIVLPQRFLAILSGLELHRQNTLLLYDREVLLEVYNYYKIYKYQPYLSY
jgi:hypothetical protein